MTCDGRLFHRQAAASGNALSPTVDRRVRRTSRDVDEAERSLRLDSVSTFQCVSDVFLGPFKNIEMAEWFTAGYFTMTLQVRRGPVGPFVSLGLYCTRFLPYDFLGHCVYQRH